jgi:membrane protein implicated in regulation of membrane protease activity
VQSKRQRMGIITICDIVTMATRPMSTGGFLVIALGLALTLFAPGATVFAVIASASSSTAIALTAFGVTISASPLDLFFAGALSVVVLGLGFALISRGTRRSARRHKELKQLRKGKAITATRAAADHEASSANDGAKDSTAGSTDKGAETLPGRHATAEQHSCV